MQRGKGLNVLPQNPGARRDISHAVVFGILKADQLPSLDFDVAKPLVIKDQKNLDFCTGFCSTELTEDQEGQEMDPLFQFAAIKKQMGEYTSYGADLRSAGMALVNSGSLPQRFAPYAIDDHPRNFLANWANYPAALWTRAKLFKKQTMFFVDGPHSLFDNIRMTLWQNRPEKRSVMLGVLWRNSWTDAPGGVIPEWTLAEPSDIDGGHCIKGFGQKTIKGKLYLKIQNSWGNDVGDGGIYYFPASVINKDFGPFGQITFKDMDPEDAHYYNENNISIDDNWLLQLAKVIAATIMAVIENFKRTALALVYGN